jgi:hypothetical protein
VELKDEIDEEWGKEKKMTKRLGCSPSRRESRKSSHTLNQAFACNFWMRDLAGVRLGGGGFNDLFAGHVV